jgi:hypothetical protein
MRKNIPLLLLFIPFFLISQNKAHNAWDFVETENPRAHWSWQNHALKSESEQDAYLDFCLNKSITEVYLFCIPTWNNNYLKNAEIGSEEYQNKLNSFIKKANNRGIKIWGLYYSFLKPEFDEKGEPVLRASGNQKNTLDYMGNTSENEHIIAAKIIMDAIGNFNLKYPENGFHGVQFDQEPRSEIYLPYFLEYCKTATYNAKGWSKKLKKMGARPFIHSAALRPSWVSRTKIIYNGKNDFVANHYLRESNHATLMNYTSNNYWFIKQGSMLLSWADKLGKNKKVVIGVEIDDIVDDWEDAKHETYFDEIEKENDSNRFNKLESDLNKANNAFLKYKSYDKIAIHSSGYIKFWFNGIYDFKSIKRAPANTQFLKLKKISN